MMILSLTGAILLGWTLGRNNLGNLFGMAVGTKMITLRTAVILAIIFIFAGAFFSGTATMSNVQNLGELKNTTDVLAVCLSAAVVLELLSRYGMPASIVQAVIGALIGWNLFYGQTVDWILARQMAFAWILCPFLGAGIGWLLIKYIRWFVQKHPIPLFQRDAWIRIGLVLSGMASAYSLGANNIGTISGPYLSVFDGLSPATATTGVCLMVAIGICSANKKVIKTVSSRLFPLSPTESFVCMTGTALTMMCFSSTLLRTGMQAIQFPIFPLVPVPVSATMIGTIVGISLAKGGYGLRYGVLGRIILSWFWVPVLTGMVCYALLLLVGL